MKDNYSSKQVNNRRNFPGNSDNKHEWGKHPNSSDAIKGFQFKPGISGNPSGARPSYKNLTDALNEIGDRIVFVNDDIFANDTAETTYREKVLSAI